VAFFEVTRPARYPESPVLLFPIRPAGTAGIQLVSPSLPIVSFPRQNWKHCVDYFHLDAHFKVGLELYPNLGRYSNIEALKEKAGTDIRL